MDMSMDGSPIIDKTPIEGLYLNCGWCYGGFKATPASGWCFAHTIATGEPAQRLNAAIVSTASRRGAVIDEKGAGRPAEPALITADADPCPLTAVHAIARSSLISAMPMRRSIDRARIGDDVPRPWHRLRLPARQPGRLHRGTIGIIRQAAAPGCVVRA
jgi:hypothetical protein